MEESSFVNFWFHILCNSLINYEDSYDTTKSAQTVEQKHSKNNNPKPLHVPREKQVTANDKHDE